MAISVPMSLLLVFGCLAVASAARCGEPGGETECPTPACGSDPATATCANPTKFKLVLNPFNSTPAKPMCCLKTARNYSKATCYDPIFPAPKKSNNCPVEPYCGYSKGSIALLTANPETYPDTDPDSAWCGPCPICGSGSTYTLAAAGPNTCAIAASGLKATSVSNGDFDADTKVLSYTVATDCKVSLDYYYDGLEFSAPLGTLGGSLTKFDTATFLGQFPFINALVGDKHPLKAVARAVAKATLSYRLKTCVGPEVCPDILCFKDDNGFAYASEDAFISAVAVAVAESYKATILTVEQDEDGNVCKINGKPVQPGNFFVDANALTAAVREAILESAEDVKTSTAECTGGHLENEYVEAIAKATACAWTKAYVSTYNALANYVPDSTFGGCSCSLSVAIGDEIVDCPASCPSSSGDERCTAS